MLIVVLRTWCETDVAESTHVRIVKSLFDSICERGLQIAPRHAVFLEDGDRLEDALHEADEDDAKVEDYATGNDSTGVEAEISLTQQFHVGCLGVAGMSSSCASSDATLQGTANATPSAPGLVVSQYGADLRKQLPLRCSPVAGVETC